jgi:hypothetical protein
VEGIVLKLLKHILLQAAKVHPRCGAPAPDGWHYEAQVGAWTCPTTGKFMVHDPTTSGYGTKKADLETGEDAKGQ